MLPLTAASLTLPHSTTAPSLMPLSHSYRFLLFVLLLKGKGRNLAFFYCQVSRCHREAPILLATTTDNVHMNVVFCLVTSVVSKESDY
jgi:hypothetical protein